MGGLLPENSRGLAVSSGFLEPPVFALIFVLVTSKSLSRWNAERHLSPDFSRIFVMLSSDQVKERTLSKPGFNKGKPGFEIEPV